MLSAEGYSNARGWKKEVKKGGNTQECSKDRARGAYFIIKRLQECRIGV